MNLKQKYQYFLREYVDKKWLQEYSCVKVLADKILDGYYVVIFDVDDAGDIIKHVYS